MSIKRHAPLALAVAAASFLASFSYSEPAKAASPPELFKPTFISRQAAKVAVSAPVSSLNMAEPILDVSNLPTSGPRNPSMPKAERIKNQLPYGEGPDGAISAQPFAPAAMPPTIVNFEGINNTSNGSLFGFTVSPPDTNGDVGRSHYVQTVNLAMQVFRLDGTPLTGVFKMSDLFAALGTTNACANGDDDGDPIVLYDHLADRWMLSQFATEGPPTHQCIAISQTGDPTGAYYVYDFVMPNDKFNDYPHFGVWPDGYYMTDNQFTGNTFSGGGAFAFNRAKMLVGDPTANFVYFDFANVDVNLGGMLPTDLDGPPSATPRPAMIAMFTATEFGDPGGDGIRLWEFTPNYTTPASSTMVEITTEAAPIAVAPFDPVTPSGRTDVPQPGTTARLDTIADRLMHRVQYRKFPTFETLVLSHTVDVSGDTTAAVFRGGVRYYELRKPTAGAWAVNEQASLAGAPGDTLNRWMPSAAMDGQGNIAVGYSVSSGTVFPGVSYAGRLASDPPGGLAQGEASIIAGSRSQTSTGARWGDYASMSVDPVDDCTFWFTTEYYGTAPPACGAATQCWQTRIASFRFPSCPAAPLNGRIQGTVRDSVTNAPVGGVTVLAGNGYAGSTDAAGVYSISVPASTVDMSATKTGYSNGTASGVAVPAGGFVTRNFSIVGVPTLTAPTRTFTDAVVGGNGNGVIDIDECPVLTIPAVNTGAGAATNTQGVLSTSTPNVTITAANASYGTVAPGGTANNTPGYIIQTGTTYSVGQPIDFSLNLTSTEGSWTQAFSLPTGSPAGAPVDFPTTPASPVAIPDNTPAGADLALPVAGLTSNVSNVTVSVRITHTWVGDLILRLTAPNGGPTVVLAANPGGGNANSDNLGVDCPASSNDLIFTDTASITLDTLASNLTNVAGSFRPNQPLSTFRGLPAATANGNWTFNAADSASIDTGAIVCVTLTIDGFTSTAGNCSVPPTEGVFLNGFEDPILH